MNSRRGLSIRALLLGAHAFVWLLPVGALLLLRVYDVYLLRQTEHQLIAESVMVGELFRTAYLRQIGREDDDHLPRPAAAQRTLSASTSEFLPIEAQIDFAQPVLAREHLGYPEATRHDPASERAGHAIEPTLRRAQTFNLSAIRVLDANGCVVATTRTQAGLCMHSQPEVAAALAGEYRAVLRERVSDEPAPALGSVRRRGKVRVFTALPVWSDGKVIAVVRASRTGLDALSSLWANRRGLLWTMLVASLLVITLSFTFSAAIARPIQRLTRAARKVAQGAPAAALHSTTRMPRELGVLQDVLFQMAEKLAQRADYVQQFASQVSHELKTPITAIRGAAELLQQGLDEMPEADRQRFVDNILEDAQRMERLVTRLLELARLENIRGEQPAELDAIARSKRLLERYGARVHVELQGHAQAPMRIDPEQLDSVLTNLVENALRHGAPHEVRVVLGAHADKLHIAVHDRGPGVSEPNRKRLFERFFTTRRDQGGTGLGLATVKAIAEARGGNVSAHFDEHGSTFRVVL